VVGARGSGLFTFSASISSWESKDELDLWRVGLPRGSGESLRMRLAIGLSVELSGAVVGRLELDSAICGSKAGGVTGGRPRCSEGGAE
jgi:hypothetical protein